MPEFECYGERCLTSISGPPAVGAGRRTVTVTEEFDVAIDASCPAAAWEKFRRRYGFAPTHVHGDEYSACELCSGPINLGRDDYSADDDGGRYHADCIPKVLESGAIVPDGDGDPDDQEDAGGPHERRALVLLDDCLVTVECNCIDPPEDRAPGDERGTDPDDPSSHGQYCPVYLWAIVRAGLEGKPFPE